MPGNDARWFAIHKQSCFEYIRAFPRDAVGVVIQKKAFGVEHSWTKRETISPILGEAVEFKSESLIVYDHDSGELQRSQRPAGDQIFNLHGVRLHRTIECQN